MAGAAPGSGGLFRFLPPRRRPQATDITAALSWGVAATAAALWLIQPVDWLKRQLFEKPEPEK